MKQKEIQNFEYGLLLIIFLIIFQQIILYLQIGDNKHFSIEYLTVSYIGTLGIAVSYFMGFKWAIGYSLGFIGIYSSYLLHGRYDITSKEYIWFFIIPIMCIVTSYTCSSRNKIYANEIRLQEINNDFLHIDPKTGLMNNSALFDQILKHKELAHRYEAYSFTTMMVRFEFMETLKLQLTKEELEQLMIDVSDIIQLSLRQEDYKFLLNDYKFIIIFPMTSAAALDIVKKRIISKIHDLETVDKQGRLLKLIIKAGILEYHDVDYELYESLEDLLLMLEKRTEVDIHPEYQA